MPEPKKPVASNADRGLERHVNPEDPTGPLLESRPDLSNRLSNQQHNRITRKRRKKVSKAKRATKAGRGPINRKRRTEA